MNVAGTTSIPPRLDTSLIQSHAGEEERGLEHIGCHNAHGGVDAEGLQCRQDGEAANAESNDIRS